MSSSPGSETNNNDVSDNMQKAKQAFGTFTSSTSRAIGSLIPTTAIQQLTTRKYTLPDKTVASQVLMYRQLLHTNAKPGLKLSRPYQGTAAQNAVKHMPWWEQGIDESKRMVISYDNLIVRLWLNGAILPYTDLMDSQETMIDEKGLPPVPHDYWVERLGFQQPDPVTDFRSGGVLSLGMMVYMVESHPDIVARFSRNGDVSILPFGLTCINVTDMMAKFLMLAKSVDRMDALLSQKPFWRMFADPNAILALQELSMSMLCDVVVELRRERQLPQQDNKSNHHSLHGVTSGEVSTSWDNGTFDCISMISCACHPTYVLSFHLQQPQVTVFDFPIVLETTEKRVGNDLLGAGPKTVEELREIHARLKVKCQKELELKEKKALVTAGSPEPVLPPSPGAAAMSASGVLESAGTAAQDVFAKFKAVSPPFMRKTSDTEGGHAKKNEKDTSNRPTNVVTEEVDFEQPAPTAAPPDLLTANSRDKDITNEFGWANVTNDETTGVTTAVGEFCIDDDEDDI